MAERKGDATIDLQWLAMLPHIWAILLQPGLPPQQGPLTCHVNSRVPRKKKHQSLCLIQMGKHQDGGDCGN